MITFHVFSNIKEMIMQRKFESNMNSEILKKKDVIWENIHLEMTA